MILNSGCSEAGNGRKQTTENPGAIFGEVKSAAGAKMLTPIALRGDKKATGHLFFELSEPAEQEVAVTFKLDSRILDAYNQLNGTGYTMYPADKLLLENNGNVVVEAGKSKSATLCTGYTAGWNGKGYLCCGCIGGSYCGNGKTYGQQGFYLFGKTACSHAGSQCGTQGKEFMLCGSQS